MLFLLLASLIWAFSFGLLGNVLAGVPPAWVAGVRLALAALVFAPFLKRQPVRDAAALAGIGAVQFGLMYLCYNASFRCLPSYQVALLTAFTPIYVALLHGRGRRLLRLLAAAGLAVAGAGVIVWKGWAVGSVKGFLLVQGSNLSFALGQLAYRGWARRGGRPPDHALMGWLYIGGLLAVLAPALLAAAPALAARQALAVAYLGIVASGLGFLLWNAGVRRASAGALAVLNNAKIPLAATVSLLVFHEKADPVRLLAGGALLVLALLLARKMEG